jgi:hypothetical protein
MIRLVKKFPFIQLVKKPTSEKRYTVFTTGYTTDPSENESMVKLSKDQLIDQRIPLTKIRFVLDTSFVYDVDNNIINPKYKVMLPTDGRSPVIEVGKPQNTMTVFLGENRTHNNFTLLKDMVKKSKRGVALLVGFNYEDVMWIANLDNAVEYYKECVNQLDYES